VDGCAWRQSIGGQRVVRLSLKRSAVYAAMLPPHRCRLCANFCPLLERSATNVNRHCERSAAIQRHQSLDCRASLAMTGGADLTQDALVHCGAWLNDHNFSGNCRGSDSFRRPTCGPERTMSLCVTTWEAALAREKIGLSLCRSKSMSESGQPRF
jgi:hypothetical protein